MTPFLLAAGSPLNHVVQHEIIKIGEGGWGFSILSNHIILQIVAGVLVCWLIPKALKQRAGDDQIGRLVPRAFGNAIEGICTLLRTHVVQPAFGKHTDRFVPYIWSAFFFVLTCNLIGIIPLADWTRPIFGPIMHGHGIGGASTGNIFVTGTLAVCTFLMIVVNGLRLHGTAYLGHFFMGPFPINLLIGVLEIIGLFAKTFALAMRLFANMVAGHVLLAVLLSFIGAAQAGLGTALALLVVSPLVVLGSVAINFLELFVAFLQAFIFTFLTATFIGQAVNIHHDEHDEERAQDAAAHAPA